MYPEARTVPDMRVMARPITLLAARQTINLRVTNRWAFMIKLQRFELLRVFDVIVIISRSKGTLNAEMP